VEPRKNIETVIRALAILRQEGVEVPLVIAGKPGYLYGSVLELIDALAVGRLVDFRGYVPDAELLDLYAKCTALLHPALYEGFGLTPLEAMYQGTPVIASNASSVPEVANAWASRMRVILDHPELRTDLATRGRRRAQAFSWERCASETVEVYADALRTPFSMH
jgi:alpha-1,3-rhamnosyl/mannosyltransferase